MCAWLRISLGQICWISSNRSDDVGPRNGVGAAAAADAGGGGVMLYKILDMVIMIVMEIELELYLNLDIVHLTVPPGQAILLVHMTCSFIPGHIMSNNEYEDEYTSINTSIFQRIA